MNVLFHLAAGFGIALAVCNEAVKPKIGPQPLRVLLSPSFLMLYWIIRPIATPLTQKLTLQAALYYCSF